MPDIPGPATLRALAANLQAPISHSETAALLAHADAWEAEQARSIDQTQQLEAARLANESVVSQLAAAQKRVEVLEEDRRWWQENALKRRRRAEARRSGRPPSGPENH